MAELLRERYGFQVKLLLNQKATKEAIYHALRNLASSSKPDDSVLIYYAGHGDLDRTYDDGWWIPADAKGGNSVTYLDNGQVQKSMRSMKARHVLLISDSCYSGTLFGQTRAMPKVIDDKYYLNLYNEKSRWGMTSGNKTPVSDKGTGDHSVFAYQLLKELRKNEKPYISTQEIYTRIAPIVGNNSEQTPLCRPIRNTGDHGGEFIFVASSGASTDRVENEVTAERKRLEQERMELERLKVEFEREKLRAERKRIEAEKKKLSANQETQKYASISPDITEPKMASSDGHHIILSDNFTDNRNQWWEATNRKYISKVENGWHTLHRLLKGSLASTKKFKKITDDVDFEIKCTVKKILGPNNKGYGIVWGRNKKEKKRFEFLINGKSSFVINKRIVGEKKTRINSAKRFKKSTHINSGNSQNNLLIQKKGNWLHFKINGYEIDKIKYQSLFGNRIGFIVFSDADPIKVAFDNLIITKRLR
jgi:hypothetical protein